MGAYLCDSPVSLSQARVVCGLPSFTIVLSRIWDIDKSTLHYDG
jgi:hypothetical protein